MQSKELTTRERKMFNSAKKNNITGKYSSNIFVIKKNL